MTAHPYHKKLARVLDRMGGLYTVNDILSAIASNEMQSFVEGESWALTRIAIYPRTKVIEVLAVVGKIDEARKLHDRIRISTSMTATAAGVFSSTFTLELTAEL